MVDGRQWSMVVNGQWSMVNERQLAAAELVDDSGIFLPKSSRSNDFGRLSLIDH
jgi:hypothetical protein